MKTCLIVNPSTDQYCGLPADGSWEGKLPACRLCLLEIRLDILEDALERTNKALATALDAVEYHLTAKAVRGQ